MVDYDLVRKHMKVRLLQDSPVIRFLPGRAVVLLAGVLMLCACATKSTINTAPPPLQGSAPVEQVAYYSRPLHELVMEDLEEAKTEIPQ